jgi:hypothetical protein
VIFKGWDFGVARVMIHILDCTNYRFGIRKGVRRSADLWYMFEDGRFMVW